MSEVLRFWCYEASNIRCVRELDYDAIQSELRAAEETAVGAYSERDIAQSELAALREELSILKHPMNSAAMLRKSLAAAEQRNVELEVFERFAGYLLDHCEGETIYEESLQYWLSESIKLYKPTESGASE